LDPSFTIGQISLAPYPPMLDVLSLCRVQQRLFDIIVLMCNNYFMTFENLFGIQVVTTETARWMIDMEASAFELVICKCIFRNIQELLYTRDEVSKIVHCAKNSLNILLLSTQEILS